MSFDQYFFTGMRPNVHCLETLAAVKQLCAMTGLQTCLGIPLQTSESNDPDGAASFNGVPDEESKAERIPANFEVLKPPRGSQLSCKEGCNQCSVQELGWCPKNSILHSLTGRMRTIFLFC